MISQEQENRHKALDMQWRAVTELGAAVRSLQNTVRILGGIDPQAESKLRYAEEIIADVRERYPR
jgi:hypothetical protein